MANEVSFERDINPGDKIFFRVDIDLYGENVARQFEFIAPKAPKLITKASIRLKIEDASQIKTGTNKSFSFNKYWRKANIDASNYILLIRLDNDKVPGSLDTNDIVRIDSSDAAIGLNNVTGTVLRLNKKRPNYLYLSVSRSNEPASTDPTAATGSIVEVKKIILKKKFTVSIGDKFIESLLAEKEPGTPVKGDSEDIIIYAYKQFNGKNKASIKKKLMSNGDEIDDKIPPPRSDVIEYRGKGSYSKTFSINEEDGEKVICYASVARYTYDGESWSGEWFQTDDSNKTIWGKAS